MFLKIFQSILKKVMVSPMRVAVACCLLFFIQSLFQQKFQLGLENELGALNVLHCLVIAIFWTFCFNQFLLYKGAEHPTRQKNLLVLSLSVLLGQFFLWGFWQALMMTQIVSYDVPVWCGYLYLGWNGLFFTCWTCAWLMRSKHHPVNPNDLKDQRFSRLAVCAITLGLAFVTYSYIEKGSHADQTVFGSLIFWKVAFKVVWITLLLLGAWSFTRFKLLRGIDVIYLLSLYFLGIAFSWNIIGREFVVPAGHWYWWHQFRYWTLLAFNIFLGIHLLNQWILEKWFRGTLSDLIFFRPASPKHRFLAFVGQYALFLLFFITAFLTSVNLVVPQLKTRDWTAQIMRDFVVEKHLRGDLEYLYGSLVWKNTKGRYLLQHLELADLQRIQFYENLDDNTYRSYILSPQVTHTPVSEFEWRREFWEYFYPRIRRQNNPMEGAEIVVRELRQRVGINESYGYDVGPTTIWRQGMASRDNFERIYVAVMRSVGIAARLGQYSRAEIFYQNQWVKAPEVTIIAF